MLLFEDTCYRNVTKCEEKIIGVNEWYLIKQELQPVF